MAIIKIVLIDITSTRGLLSGYVRRALEVPRALSIITQFLK